MPERSHACGQLDLFGMPAGHAARLAGALHRLPEVLPPTLRYAAETGDAGLQVPEPHAALAARFPCAGAEVYVVANSKAEGSAPLTLRGLEKALDGASPRGGATTRRSPARP